MKLVDFQGLNCYQNALVTVAAFLGVDYKRAFFNLWPETDFDYDRDHKVYLTKRMPRNLEALGIQTEELRFAPEEEAGQALSIPGGGEPFLVGMDTFHIPWSPSCGIIHDMHYFAARQKVPGLLSCADPTYNTQYAVNDAFASLFSKVIFVNRVAEKTLLSESSREEILRCHPHMQSRLLDAMGQCSNEKRQHALLIAKYVDAMINNRYLYAYYLDNTPFVPVKQRSFFDKDFFARWNAVKNGLYKAFVVRRSEDIMDGVSALFKRLTDEELLIAADAEPFPV